MIQPLVRSILVNDPTISAMVDTRVYDIVFPSVRTPTPAIILQRISETYDSVTMSRATTLQVDSYALSHETAQTLDTLVSQLLTNLSGVVASDVEILNIIPVNSLDFYTPDNKLYRVATDYSVFWRLRTTS